MNIDFWAKTNGTWINAVTVLLGTFLGLFLKNRLPKRMQHVITQALGLLTLFIGLNMASRLTQAQAGRVDGVILGLLAVVLGGLLGEWWRIEENLQSVGNWLKVRFQGGGRFTEGFVAASLLFCVGPLSLIGSLNNGLTGDNTLLTLKSVMDGLAAIALTSSFGVGVGFSVLVILLYQGGVSLVAGVLSQALPNPGSDPRLFLVTGVGGLMILGLGLNLLEVAQVRVASFLPALALAPVMYFIAELLGHS